MCLALAPAPADPKTTTRTTGAYRSAALETREHQGYDFSDFFDTNTMKYGPKGGAPSEEKTKRPGFVDGFGLFEKGYSSRTPGFDPPPVIKEMLKESDQKRQQKLEEQQRKKRG